MPKKILINGAILIIILLGLILAIRVRFEAKFPDVWPLLVILGMALSFSIRYNSKSGIGIFSRILSVLCGLGIVVAVVLQYL